MREPRFCSAPRCNRRHYGHGYCKKHHAQVLRHGRLTPEREQGPVRVCKARGCGRKDTIHWYCRKHARQLRVHGRLTPELEILRGLVGCTVPRCEEPHRAKGLCEKHYHRARYAKLAEARGARKARRKRGYRT